MLPSRNDSAQEVHQYSGQILVVDDDPVLCDLLSTELEEHGFRVTTTHSLAGLRAKIKERGFHFALVDLFLENEDGLEALPILARESPYTRIIVMSAHGTVELAVGAMERGANTFISKSKDSRELISGLLERIRQPVAPTPPAPLVGKNLGIIGQSSAMQDVLMKIAQLKDVSSTVLITGESGTGKELVARAIHNVSQRSQQRFEAINCGAIPETLLESELFGHKRGAFTDAKMDRKGLFELCSEGTLFLDEIGEMPLNLQVKLLRVLQEKEVMPLGSSHGIKVNTRVIAATNRNLPEEVRSGRFREDLYYRLAVLQIRLPALRERRDDIPVLISHFLERYNERFGKSVQPPSKELEARLLAYSWPGNIRELQNAVERGVVLAQDDKLALENMLEPADQGLPCADTDNVIDAFCQKPLSAAKQDFERSYLSHLLQITRGNISEMARISGRYRADIYRLLTKHGVQWEEFRP